MRKRIDRRPSARRSHPFWLPASTFYFLAAAVAIGIFFLVWAILNDGRDNSPWIAAGLFSSVSMMMAVVVREVILRHRRANIYAKQRRLDNAVLSAPVPVRSDTDPDKLTLERNTILIEEIVRKSEAAKVLSRLPESHREVFLLCDAYIEAAQRELPHIGVGSPRLAAIRRGRDKIEGIHKLHMLKWAEIEARSLTEAASVAKRTEAKLEKARAALNVVETAASRYPEQNSLIESRIVLEELIATIGISRLIGLADKAESKGSTARALKHLREASSLTKSVHASEKMTEAEERLSSEIARLEILNKRNKRK